jgi:hypothetical protein
MMARGKRRATRWIAKANNRTAFQELMIELDRSDLILCMAIWSGQGLRHDVKSALCGAGLQVTQARLSLDGGIRTLDDPAPESERRASTQWSLF